MCTSFTVGSKRKLYSVLWVQQVLQVVEVFTLGNWHAHLDPFVRLEGHPCGGFDIEESDVLLSIRVNTIDGLMKRRGGIEEVRGGHDDGHIVRALQVQQAVDTRLKLERLVLAVGDVPGVLLI